MTYCSTLPNAAHGLTDQALSLVNAQVDTAFRQALTDLQIDDLPDTTLQRIYLPLAAALAKAAREKAGTLVVGVNGAQGSGKTTLCCLLSLLLDVGFKQRVASFSIDDLYRTHAERSLLGQTVHPLLATRGVPGTHDVEMGLQLLTDLTNPQSGHRVPLPVFDKTTDDRSPRSAWRMAQTPLDIVLFEGWCVGVCPQSDQALEQPINTLEESDDPQGTWRSHVNKQLAGDYKRLFARLDLLIMLEIPDMASVFAWRGLQEEKLAAQSQGAKSEKLMDKAALHRFIMHYERLTRHMLSEMPKRANIVLRLDATHQVAKVRINNWPSNSEQTKHDLKQALSGREQQ